MVKKQQILGLTSDERLNWKEHSRDLKVRTKTKLNLLKSLSYTAWGSDQKTLLQIHQMSNQPSDMERRPADLSHARS
jgi:hypothetical protein